MFCPVTFTADFSSCRVPAGSRAMVWVTRVLLVVPAAAEGRDCRDTSMDVTLARHPRCQTSPLMDMQGSCGHRGSEENE